MSLRAVDVHDDKLPARRRRCRTRGVRVQIRGLLEIGRCCMQPYCPKRKLQWRAKFDTLLVGWQASQAVG
jgi:hypothetical protein